MGQASGQDRAVGPTRDHASWDLVADITLDVWRTGCYLAGVGHPDQLATIRGAAEQAARVVGVPARLDVTEPVAGDDPPLVVMVRFADAGGLGGRRARTGLAALLQSVRRHQARARRGHALDR